jgi:UDP-N-acetylmuramoyl-tripeptide--D-alanyl-D-alanine ligase
MVERNAAFAAAAMGATVTHGEEAVRWRGAVLDSRRITGGEIFFALRGEQVDGHAYAGLAAARGAAAIVVERDVEADRHEAAWLRVDSTYEALHALTRAVRAEVPRRLVGITGSAGKTTTKELLHAMLARRFKTTKSLGNFNNLYGFPIALLGIEDDCEWMVAEMGMSTPGELAGVSRLGRPDVALFTNVLPVHLENFPNLRGIAEAKAGLLAGLAEDGLVVANADDPEVERIARRYESQHGAGRVVRFGIRNDADVTATAPEPRLPLGSRFELTAAAETVTVELPVHGLYNAENCLAAAATAHALGIPLGEIAAAAAAFAPADGRGEIHRLTGGVTLIDDSYNSNPDAAIKALESARHLAGGRHLAVLGDMLELGDGAEAFHRQVGTRAAELGFGPIVGVGVLAEQLVLAARQAGADAILAKDATAAARRVGSCVRDDDVVLVKGSRGIALETVALALLNERGEAL